MAFFKDKLNLLSVITGLVLVILFAVPFMFNKELTNWDFNGHVFEIEFDKANTIPDYENWQPYNGLGYSHGPFYPFLIKYIISVISWFSGLSAETLVKIFFLLVLLVIPYSILYFTRSIAKDIGLDDKPLPMVLALQITLIALIFAPGGLYPGSIQSFFELGFINNVFINPFIFFYIGFVIKNGKKSLNLRNTILLSLFLSFILLSHFVAGLVCGLFTVAVWILHSWNRNPRSFFENLFRSKYLYPLIIAFVMTMFYFIPYILNNSYIGQIRSPLVSSKLISFSLSILFGLILGLQIKNNFKYRYGKSSVALGLTFFFFILFSVIESVISTNVFTIPNFGLIQPYRTLALIIFLSIPWIFFGVYSLFTHYSPTNNFINFFFSNKIFYTFQGALLILFFLGIYFVNFHIFSDGYLVLKNEKVPSGTYFSLVRASENYQQFRTNYIYPLYKYDNIRFVNTQSDTETFLDPITEGLVRSVYGPPLIENPIYPDSYRHTDESRVKFLLKLFGVDRVIFIDKKKFNFPICASTPEEWGYLDTRLNKTNPFTFYFGQDVKYEQTKLYYCEVDYTGIKTDVQIESDAKPDFKGWTYDFKNGFNNLLIKSDKDFDSFSIYNGEYKWSNNFNTFEINNRESASLTVLTIQYSPKWKAFDENGNTIPTYRVSPNQLSIENNGKIRFEYTLPDYEYILRSISYTTIIISLIILIFEKRILKSYNRK